MLKSVLFPLFVDLVRCKVFTVDDKNWGVMEADLLFAIVHRHQHQFL